MLLVAPLLDRPKFSGGRGTLRAPALEEPRPPALPWPSVRGVVVARELKPPDSVRPELNEAPREAAGGVMRLTVGRDIALLGAAAAGRPAFAPNRFCAVAPIPGRPIAGALRIALALT